MLRVAERRKRSTYAELCSGGPQELVVLGSESAGAGMARLAASCSTYSASGRKELRQLSAAAAAGWSRRWWGILAVAVQQAVASTALGQAWPAPLHPCQRDEPPLERVLELAGAATSPSRLPLRS